MAGTPFKMKGFSGFSNSPAKQLTNTRPTGAAILSQEQKKKLDSSGRFRSTALGDKISAFIVSVIGGKKGLFKNPENKSYKELKAEARSKYGEFIGTSANVKKITVDEFTK